MNLAKIDNCNQQGFSILTIEPCKYAPDGLSNQLPDALAKLICDTINQTVNSDVKNVRMTVLGKVHDRDIKSMMESANMPLLAAFLNDRETASMTIQNSGHAFIPVKYEKLDGAAADMKNSKLMKLPVNFY